MIERKIIMIKEFLESIDESWDSLGDIIEKERQLSISSPVVQSLENQELQRKYELLKNERNDIVLKYNKQVEVIKDLRKQSAVLEEDLRKQSAVLNKLSEDTKKKISSKMKGNSNAKKK